MTATSVPLLLAAAAGVGIAHSILPDHWVPLAVVARSNRWSLGRTAKVSFLASLGHVAVSLVLGVILAAAGLALRKTIVAEEGQIVGGVLVLTGLGFLIWALLTRGHGHSHVHGHGHTHLHLHDHSAPAHDHEEAASAVGVGAAIGTLVTFALATLCTFVVLTVVATIGGYQVQWPWLDDNGHVVSALVLLLVGVLVFARV